MKTIGRIILLVVCGFMGYTAVKTSMGCFDAFKTNNWLEIGSYGEMIKVVGTFLMQLVTLVFALSGIVAALKGRASLKFTLLSLILFLNIVFTFVNAFGSGATFDFAKVLDITLSCLCPILYVTGAFLIRL